MTAEKTTGWTVHPFNDEWLWLDDGVNPIEFATAQEGAAYAADYRKDMRKGQMMDADFVAGMWFALHPADGSDEDMALVGPDDRLLEHGEALTTYELIGGDGEWPPDADG